MSSDADSLQEEALWVQYRTDDGSPASRDALLGFYAPFARSVVLSLYSRFRWSEVDVEELEQEAQIGLMEAIERFDPERGATFKTFATYRIRGALLDAIARVSENLNQAAFRRRVQAERMRAALEKAAASQKPLLAQVVDVTLEVALSYVLETEAGLAEAVSAPTPYGQTDYQLIGDKLPVYLASLTENERQVISYHYLEGMAFQQIAEVLSLSKARVSQLHSRALGKLSERLSTPHHLDEGV